MRPALVIRMAEELAALQAGFYRGMVSRFPAESDEALLMGRLASEEEEHRRAFGEMARMLAAEGGGAEVAPEQAERIALLMNRKVLKRYADRAERFRGGTTCSDLFLLAAMVESDALLFYYSLEPFLAGEHRRILEGILKEEGSHREFVLDLFCRSRRFRREEALRKALEQDFASSYREAEVRDLAFLVGLLEAFTSRSSADVTTLVEGVMGHLQKLMEPALALFFVLGADGRQMYVRKVVTRGGTVPGLPSEPVPLERLAAARALEKGVPVQIRDRKDLESCRGMWDFVFVRERGEEPERVVAIPVPGVGVLEMVNVRQEFGLSATNALLLEVIGGVLRVLSLGKAGLERLGEVYQFFAFLAAESAAEVLYRRTLEFVVGELGGGKAAIFLYSADRKKVFLVDAEGFASERLRLVPRSSEGSPVLAAPVAETILRVEEGATVPEVEILAQMTEVAVGAEMVAAVFRDGKGQPTGSLWVFGREEGFGAQDLTMMEFLVRQLGQSLNRRKQMREMDRIQREGEFLSRYFSPNLLRRLKRGEEIQKEGVSEEITVLFADIRGFTALSERMDPQGVVRLLNSYFGTMVRIILQNDGVIDKFIGDAVFVYWGVPVRHKNDTLLAVLTALAMQEEVRYMKERGRLPEDLQVGIGVHVGPAVLGNIGSETRLEFTAIGDTVNTASRLCGIAPGGEIIVSGPVWKRIFYDLEVVPFGKKVLTGKTQEILTYRVQSLKDDYFTTYRKAF